MILRNPILRGFNPDPSIIRVGSDYYIATSTFEWFPGVQIHHSKDLAHWELITRPLDRTSQLNMIGVPDSGGVWAPCLSYDGGTFYLVYSNVKSFDGVWKDTPNYLVTAKDIKGPWSDPVFMGASGFDGSLFHDENGKKYFLSMLVDHRGGKFFGGIILQEFDEAGGKCVGPVHHIFRGTELGKTEGPHLYQKDGYYYLLTAEGGTEYGHAVTIARAREITGPYEVHPENPLFTASHHPEVPFQRTGHADIVESEDQKWFIVYLASRPLPPHRRCILGRETVLEELEWPEGDWPRPKSDSQLTRSSFKISDASDHQAPPVDQQLSFDTAELDIHFQSLRVPITENWCSLKDRPGFLRLYGRESLSSLHRQSLIARRVQAFRIEASTRLEFQPEHFQQMAGLVCYYNTYHWHYLHLMGGTKGERFLQLITCDKYSMNEPLEHPIPLPHDRPIFLKVHWDQADIQYFYAIQEGEWKTVGPLLDGSILSDDYVRDDENRYRPAFTGAFVGVSCQDLSGMRKPADFGYWRYRELVINDGNNEV